MAKTTIISDTRAGPASEPLAVRHIGLADLLEALRQGMADFWATPTHLVFIGILLVGFAYVWKKGALQWD